MKKRFWIILLVIGCNLLWMTFLLSPGNRFVRSLVPGLQEQEPLIVALAGPMTGDGFIHGRDMVRGARMALQDSIDSGRLPADLIKTGLYDDQNEVRFAMKAASEISLNNRVIGVLGHFLNKTTIAAGNIYAKNGIPLITGSATEKVATNGNPWAFGTIPDNFDQALSIITHVRAMGRHISVIYEKDDYCHSIMPDIKKNAAEAGIEIRYQWAIKTAEDDIDERLEEIIDDLRTIQDPGVIIIATQSHEGEAILTSIKHPGTDYTVIGTKSFATNTFFKRLTSLPQERAKPGYYLNGVYGCTPFLTELGNHEQNEFVENYRLKFGESPTWVAACYYDAMKVLIEAVELNHLTGRRIREERTQIRSTLNRFSTRDEAVNGVTGPLFFDAEGRIKRLYAMGYYENQQFRPAFTQYHIIGKKKDSVFKKTMGNKITMAAGNVLSRKELVFTGIDINAVDSLSFKNEAFAVDYYIWFRFNKDFNEKRIIFENTENPIVLKKPVLEIHRDGYSVRAYKIKAEFKQNLKYDEFPFEKHHLGISFHHQLQIDQKLVFIPDYLSIHAHLSPEAHILPENTSEWEMERLTQTRDTLKKQIGSLTLNYSRYNARALVKRIDCLFPFKILIPLLGIALFLSFSYLLPVDFIKTRLFIIFPMEIINGVCHYYLRSIHQSDAIIQVEINFFAIYILGMLALMITCTDSLYTDTRNHKWIKPFNFIGQGVHVLVIVYLIGMNVIKFY